MITKYSNAQAHYDELFAKATARLNELKVKNSENKLYDAASGVMITTLEEYFSNLRNLIYGPDENPLDPNDPIDMESIKEGYVFLKLPVDEPYFVINANTREVTVPDVFKKNGISVLGDEVSEMLFFSIDRFYDATDLSQLNIAFYWSRANDPDRTVYSTPAFFSVIESDDRTGDDKLIFGWPISSEITKEAGKITFSVRFYAKDQSVNEASDEFSLLYSLSTLPQTVFINAGLSYDIKDIDVDNRLDDILFTRLVNSPLGKADPPSMPQLIFARTKKGEDYLADFTSTPGVFNIAGQIVDPVQLAVLGYRPGAGTLTYSWWYKAEDGSDPVMISEGWTSPILGSDNYILAPSFIEEGDKTIATYYYKDGTAWHSDVFTKDQFNSAGRDLYVKCAIYQLINNSDLRPGTYFACPRNTLHGQNKSVVETDTPVYAWVVHGPDTPVITETSWHDAEVFTFERNQAAQLSIKGSGLNTTSKYTWYADTTNMVAVDDLSKLDMKPMTTANNSTINVTTEGYYRVDITNTQNNGTKTTSSSTVLVLGNYIDPLTDCYLSREGNTVTVNHRELKPFEEVQYHWYASGDFNNPIMTTTENSYTYDALIGNCGVKVVVKKNKNEALQATKLLTIETA